MSETYDVVIIGAGAAGENVSGRTAPGGLRTLIIDAELVGGECTYWACMPSKALLRASEALAHARAVPAAAGAVTGTVDAAAVLRSRDAFASNWDDAPQVKWVESVGAGLLRGRARLVGERRVAVELTGDEGGGELEVVATKAVVLATGSAPAVPPVPGLAEAGYWTNREVTSAQEVPESLIIIGGGPVGLEMAQAWKRLGTREVTLVDRATPDTRANIEPFAARVVCDELMADGVDVRHATSVDAVSGADGEVTAALSDGTSVTAQHIVVATGRRPATDHLGLETIGLEPGRFVQVNDHLQAEGIPEGWLYAVGDANGRALFTHQGKYQARQAGDHILGKPGAAAWADSVAVPAVIFTDPQIGMVGLTERQARERGFNTRAVELGWPVSAAPLHGRDTRGGVKFVVDEDRRLLLGATFVGPGAGELVHGATIAIVGEVPLERLWHAAPAFPTFSEVWLRFLEAYGL